MRDCPERTVLIDARRTQWHPFTGIPRYVRGLLEAIDDQPLPDLEIVVLIDSFFPTPSWLSQLSFRTHAVRWQGSAARQLLWDIGSLHGVFRRGRYGLYHMPWFERPPSRQIKTVVTLHDLHMLWGKRVHKTGAERLYSHFARRCLTHADGLLFVSQAGRTEAEVLSGGIRQPWRVTPLGWPTIHPEDSHAPPAAAVRAPKLDPPVTRVLILGATSWRKNSERLARELDILSRSVRDLEVITTGAGWSQLLANRVWHIGYDVLDDASLVRLMRASSCLVVGSIWEGQALPVMEAIGNGLPVVCTDLPAVREGSPPGVTYVRESAALGAYALAIQYSIQSRSKESLTDLATSQYLSRYTWSTTAAATLDIYGELLDT